MWWIYRKCFTKISWRLGKFVKKTLTDSLTKNLWRTVCAAPSLPAINEFKRKADYKVYGGAPFLGVKRPVLKAHGSSDETVFYYTLKQAEEFAKGNSVEKMTKDFLEYKNPTYQS